MQQAMMPQQDQAGYQAGYHTGYHAGYHSTGEFPGQQMDPIEAAGYGATGEFPGQQMDPVEADIEHPRSGGFSILPGGRIYPHPHEMGRNTPAGDDLT
jgi:hypothetical protein